MSSAKAQAAWRRLELMPTLLDQLQEIPLSWGLVAVDGSQAPIPAWLAIQATHQGRGRGRDHCRPRQGHRRHCWPVSGGLLFLDHDGISATEQLEKLGIPPRSLPRTAVCTSGRDGRFQALFTVPKHYWPQMRNRRVFDTGKVDADGKAENLDLRWNRHQSVVIGAHPITGAYRWVKNRSPAEAGVAQATEALIKLLIDEPQPVAASLFSQAAPVMPATLPLFQFITRDSLELIETGGTPGQWNDDQLKLALDLQGTEEWIIAQGHRPDISAADAFEHHINAARGKAKDFDVRKARKRFDGAAAPSTLSLAPLSTNLNHASPITPAPSAASWPIRQHPPATAADGAAPMLGKPTKLEAGELLAMLRTQAGDDRIRYNRFSQQIEMDGAVIEGSERFYLSLAEQGYKVSKELAIDCLIQVAHEHPYDPVALYLEHVAATVAGLHRWHGHRLPQAGRRNSTKPTIYDQMIRCTLIGAVRRAFEPGCKHDTACVLMGDQGARKSSFWESLGGAFFSDALGDISSKDDLMILHRSWIMEWAELDHIMGRKHAGQVKAFLSNPPTYSACPTARRPKHSRAAASSLAAPTAPPAS
jgi:hypothetical protein